MANKEYHNLYKTQRWLKLRKHQLTKHPLCAIHLAKGEVVVATVADHIKPHRGNRELFFNGKLQSLCASCHSSDKQASEHEANSVVKPVGIDGYPTEGDW